MFEELNCIYSIYIRIVSCFINEVEGVFFFFGIVKKIFKFFYEL